nr:hypothetical protein [uncultured Prevotella sp.]
MMRKITITDVGPITKTATIEFKRFCILIGPQSNGKSTMAKILSTCMWLEKEACVSLSESVLDDGQAFVDLVENFHRMHNYIHSDRSVIEYESPFVSIKYNKGDFQLSFKNNLEYNRTKISYMPSDRNIITMKDIEKRELEPTNFRSFLFDWLDTNRHYDVNHKMPILNLDMQYYHDDKAKDRMDMLAHENGVTYNIPLYDASSGMQSLVPMSVLMHYLVTGYFDNYGKDLSFEQQKKNTDLAWAITKMVTTKYYPQEVKKLEYREVYYTLVRDKANDGDVDAVQQMQEIKELYGHLVNPKSISFVLEEPEQNLFPQTQVDLFNDVVALCNGEHASAAFITTHSPYILAAANILLFVDILKKQGVAEELIKNAISTTASISIDDFSAYVVSEGTCRSLIDDETHLISENELDLASEYNAEIFDKLSELYAHNL